MKKISALPRYLTAELSMSDYHEGAEGGFVVWINPPERVMDGFRAIYGKGREIAKEMGIIEGFETRQDYLVKLTKLNTGNEEEKALYMAWLEKTEAYAKNEKNTDVAKWLSLMLSKGVSAETHYSEAEILELIERTQETDPSFIDWIALSVNKMVQDYRAGRKKNKGSCAGFSGGGKDG